MYFQFVVMVNFTQLQITVESPFHEEFEIPADLVGLAIGSHGHNIQVAREIEGVTDVSFDPDNNTFKVK